MLAVIVFGGTGFVGSALVKFLLSQDLKVLVYKHKSLGFLDGVESDNLIYFDSFDENKLKEYNIITLFHLASRLSNIKPLYSDFYDANVKLTLEIIELAKELNIKQFIYCSTGSLFTKPDKSTIFSETTPPNPLNYYGLTKYIAEKLLSIEFAKDNVQVSIIRFPSIFGANDSIGIVNMFYSLAKRDENIEVFSNGERYRSLVYIDNAVEILFSAYQNRNKLSNYEIFVTGSSDSMKIIDIANEIVKLTNSKSKVIPIDKFPPSDFDVHIDTSKAKKVLNYKPMSITNGLKKYVEVKK